MNSAFLEEAYQPTNVLTPAASAGALLAAGPDEYIVMGDNRRESEDSRAYGPIRRSRICGRVTSSTSRFHQSSILRR
jgi:hypothetical protein